MTSPLLSRKSLFFAPALLAVFTMMMLSARSAHADASGRWKGAAKWTFADALVACSLQIQFSESPEELRRDGGEMTCDDVVVHSDLLTWKKDGTILKLDGEPAGHWDDNGFEVVELPGEDVEVTSRFSRSGERSAHYSESWKSLEDGSLLYQIESDLSR